MLEATRELVELLALNSLGNDHFQGQSQDLGFPAVFGGQVLGQGLMAASRTVDNRMPHSMHAYFLRPGDHNLPIDYEVQRVRDGGTFSVRRVIARQQGKEILTGSVSFQVEEEGFDHQVDMPFAPDVDDLDSEQQHVEKVLPQIPEELQTLFTRDRPIEIRPVDPVDIFKPDVRPPFRQSWLKAQGQLPDDPIVHRCLLAYASDFNFLGTALQPHGMTFADRRVQAASLDHAIWFHRDFRMDDWLLYDKDSPSASGGRGLNRGNIFSRDGALVASTAQEALIRRRR
ncbi:MAG: acyl-CoA thioesterase II [Oleiphilaceae bacterium]|nr:acyl-CoA thioesterase II [Oleiphilaceae bacterium]